MRLQRRARRQQRGELGAGLHDLARLGQHGAHLAVAGRAQHEPASRLVFHALRLQRGDVARQFPLLDLCLQGDRLKLSLQAQRLPLQVLALARKCLPLGLQAKQLLPFGLDLGAGYELVLRQRFQPSQALLRQRLALGMQLQLGVGLPQRGFERGDPRLQRGRLALREFPLLHLRGAQRLLAVFQGPRQAVAGRVGAVERQHEQHVALSHLLPILDRACHDGGALRHAQPHHAALGHQQAVDAGLAGVFGAEQEGADRDDTPQGQQTQPSQGGGPMQLHRSQPGLLLRGLGFGAEERHHDLLRLVANLTDRAGAAWAHQVPLGAGSTSGDVAAVSATSLPTSQVPFGAPPPT